MKIERPNHRELTPEELAHLEALRRLVREALADGRISRGELQSIWGLIETDHIVSVEELSTFRQTVRDVLGNADLEYDWD
ncbi:hypothetical protein C7271_09205 [filamentous cyanobacterium CCP5]|nr:hypothetical protein C7271_09205 [filamentous cyanobacterium CCP5]